MNENPKITVIVPVYNTEKYLRRCVDSILAQTFTDFELLLIDDGSTDGSSAICDEYAKKDSRVRVFHKENGGVSSARNLGLDKAYGEWISFVDSDDWIDVLFLSSLIQRANNSELVLELTNTKVIKNIYQNRDIGVLMESVEVLLRWTTPWGKLFNGDLLRKCKIRFDLNVHSGEDTMFVLEYLAQIERVSVSDEICYKYTENGGLSLNELSFKEIDYIIKSLLYRVDILEQKYRIDLIKWKTNFVWNFITKYKIQKGIKKLYEDLYMFVHQDYIKIVVEDKLYIPKGVYRHMFDVLFKYKMCLTLTFFVYCCKRFYY